MTIEERLRNALAPELVVQEASPDLFARVRRSMAEDRRRRSARARWLAGGAVGVGLVVAFLAVVTEVRNGHLLLGWGWLEGLVTAAMVGLTIGVGPLIRRSGRNYAEDVFRMTPDAGRAFLRLLDIAFYLVFAGYILINTRIAPEPGWGIFLTPAQLRDDAVRIGGLLLAMGVLHGLNLLLLPVVGRLFGLNRQLAEQRSPDPEP